MADTGYHNHDTAILSQPLITDMYQTKNTRNTKTKIGSILYLHAKFNLLPTASVQQHHRWMSSIQYTRSVYPWLQMMQCTHTEQQQHPNQSWKMPSHCLPGTSSLQAKVYAWFQQPLHLISKPLWNAANVFLLPPVPKLFRWCFCGFLRGFWFWFWFRGGSVCSGFLHSFLPWGLDWLCLHWLPHWKNTSMSSVYHQGQYSPWECMEASGFWKPLVSEMKVVENQ